MIEPLINRLCVVSVFVSSAFLASANLHAQDAPKAFVMVDINVEKARDYETFKKFIDEAPMKEFFSEFDAEELSVSDIKRIRAAAAPSVIEFALFGMQQDFARNKKMEELGFYEKKGEADEYDEEEEEKRWAEIEAFDKKMMEEMQRQTLEFFVQIEFSSSEIAKQFIEGDFIPASAPRETVDGKTVVRTPAGKLFGIYFDGNTKLTVGSDQYLFDNSSLKATESINSYFSDNYGNAVRVAVDLDAVRPQIAKIKETGEFPVMVFGIVDAIRSGAMSIDLSNDEMANLVVNTTNESNAELIASQINGLLRPIKMQASQAAGQLFPEGSAEAESMVNFFKGLKCDVDGAAAKMNITKPEGFDAMVSVAIEKATIAAKAARKLNYFRQVAISVHDYHDAHNRCPFGTEGRRYGHKDLSWRVLLTPFNENMNVYRHFNMEEAWDSETNKPLSKQMPELYGLGEQGEMTSICWIKATDRAINFAGIKDGLSNTIMFMENPTKVVWSKPGDLTVDEAVALVKSLKDGEELIITMYDTSIRKITNKMDIETLKAMCTIDGGEVIDGSMIR